MLKNTSTINFKVKINFKQMFLMFESIFYSKTTHKNFFKELIHALESIVEECANILPNESFQKLIFVFLRLDLQSCN